MHLKNCEVVEVYIDKLLVELGVAASLTQARSLIRQNAVSVAGDDGSPWEIVTDRKWFIYKHIPTLVRVGKKLVRADLT